MLLLGCPVIVLTFSSVLLRCLRTVATSDRTGEYDNKVNESEIKTSNLDQVQQFFNEDTDVVFDALVAADYIDEIDCTDGTRQPLA